MVPAVVDVLEDVEDVSPGRVVVVVVLVVEVVLLLVVVEPALVVVVVLLVVVVSFLFCVGVVWWTGFEVPPVGVVWWTGFELPPVIVRPLTDRSHTVWDRFWRVAASTTVTVPMATTNAAATDSANGSRRGNHRRRFFGFPVAALMGRVASAFAGRLAAGPRRRSAVAPIGLSLAAWRWAGPSLPETARVWPFRTRPRRALVRWMETL